MVCLHVSLQNSLSLSTSQDAAKGRKRAAGDTEWIGVVPDPLLKVVFSFIDLGKMCAILYLFISKPLNVIFINFDETAKFSEASFKKRRIKATWASSKS